MFYAIFGDLVGWGCGALISLFLDFTASHGLNRKQPGVPNRIQVDSWPNRIATLKLVSWCTEPAYTQGNVVTSLFTRSNCNSVHLAVAFWEGLCMFDSCRYVCKGPNHQIHIQVSSYCSGRKSSCSGFAVSEYFWKTSFHILWIVFIVLQLRQFMIACCKTSICSV